MIFLFDTGFVAREAHARELADMFFRRSSTVSFTGPYIVFGARGIVPVVCAIVFSKGS